MFFRTVAAGDAREQEQLSGCASCNGMSGASAALHLLLASLRVIFSRLAGLLRLVGRRSRRLLNGVACLAASLLRLCGHMPSAALTNRTRGWDDGRRCVYMLGTAEKISGACSLQSAYKRSNKVCEGKMSEEARCAPSLRRSWSSLARRRRPPLSCRRRSRRPAAPHRQPAVPPPWRPPATTQHRLIGHTVEYEKDRVASVRTAT